MDKFVNNQNDGVMTASPSKDWQSCLDLKMIGIYGGTFDPVHYGHLRTALEVKEIFQLDQLRLIPCHQSPLKNSSQVTPFNRLQMLQLAIQDEKGLVCDSRELHRKGHSYMVDTLKSLREELPNTTLLLFMGNDAFVNLSRWYQWQTLFAYAHIVVMTRPQSEKIPLCDFLTQCFTTDKSELSTKTAGKLFFQPVTQLDISATVIRKLQATGRSIRFLLPDNVIHYIEQHTLYNLP
jgi:nicotinate-nucleotide adenylyltransferase